MAHEELLAWSAGRLPWQQDALRRLATQGELTADDLLALQLQIEQAAGLPVEDIPEPVPLAEEHLNQAASNNPRTVLASLGPVRHVDRLSSDQPPLRFAINGITLVYGANASGKSGYCRIARQLCRSLSPVDLRGNVYETGAPAPPEVAVAFRVGGDDQPKEELTWYADQDPPAELSRISVFDTASARVYVDRQRKIEFLPYELDLMNKLGLACRSLEKRFRERLASVNATLSTPLPEAYHEGTAVQATLARLVTQSALEDLPSEPELRAFGSWSAEKQAAFETAEEHLRQDPQVVIRLRSEAKQALETVKAEASAIEEELADPSLAAIRQKRRDAENTRRAVEAAARDLFSDQPIPDLGSETWRLMLTYAREFSVAVFPDAPPPQLASGGLCVLCQQGLDDNAATRMAAFDDYIVGRAAEESVAADRALAEHRDRLLAFRVRPQREVEVLLTGYAGLSDASKEAAATIAAFVEKAGERLDAIKGALRDNRYDALHDLDPLPVSPAQFIQDEVGRLDSEITQLEVAERDEEALAKLKARHADFADRKRLSEQVQIVVERRNRLEERHRFEVCAQQCRSTAITRRITDRRREILTPTLRAALEKELERLRLTHIPLDLTDRGRDVESIIEIALDARQRVAKSSDILSEGEQRALALACFLAELQEIGTDHGIIVDDPVSSLDHSRMRAVAERLTEEASNGRQVIVFTHNILFHHMLWTAARRAKVGRHREWMSSAGNDRFSLIDDSQKPWQMKRVPERLSEIHQGFAALTRDGYDHTDQRFRSPIVDLYTKMRTTWERIVEEVLFNNVVQRFRPEVMTQRLEEACIDPSADYPAIFEGMKRCSHFSGHDQAPDLPPDLPEPREVGSDIAELQAFADMARERRRQFGKGSSYEDGIKAVLL